MTLREAQLTLQENFKFLSSEHPRIVEALKVAMECLDREIDLDFETDNVNVAAKQYANRGVSFNADPYEETMAYQADVEAFKAGVEWMTKEHAGQVAEAVERGFNAGVEYAQEQGDEVIV